MQKSIFDFQMRIIKCILSAYFRYLATFKVAILVFNLTPYLALRIVGS